MKLSLITAVFLTGCSGTDITSIYDITHPAYEGGAGGTVGEGDNNSVDASICKVPGHATVTGTLGGAAFAPKDAIEVFDSESAKFVIRVTDYASACTYASDLHASSSVIAITYDQTLLSAGSLDIAKTPSLSAKHIVYGTTCAATTTTDATSGTVTFSKVNQCGAQGTFDLTFGTDHVTATFTASVCPTSGESGACH